MNIFNEIFEGIVNNLDNTWLSFVTIGSKPIYFERKLRPRFGGKTTGRSMPRELEVHHYAIYPRNNFSGFMDIGVNESHIWRYKYCPLKREVRIYKGLSVERGTFGDNENDSDCANYGKPFAKYYDDVMHQEMETILLEPNENK